MVCDPDWRDKISNGTKIVINKTGTQVKFIPGLLQGGELELDCSTQRCISYFLEPLVLMAPFCKVPIHANLKGVTNAPNELSVDAIRATWLPVFNKFVINDENLSLKINARGFLPDGGGSVTFNGPIVRTLRSVQREKPGKICKIRGLAYVCKVSPSFAARMIDAAKKMLRGYIADVYITVDQRKGVQGGSSPGFGIFLTAETTEGVFYHGEEMSCPKGSKEDQVVAEDVGRRAAENLLSEIHRGGCMDSSAQILATTFMTLCEKDVSKFLFGPLPLYTVHALRNLSHFFDQKFKIDEVWKIKESRESDENVKEKKEILRELRTGSNEKALMTCIGVGYFNINKVML
ncbi:RNA 3'-terminal phosphate cyclase domain-containing protein [Ditylenchus destructor]|uniref:RNA 3'-terminal phosphate cyclase domain-containing protein n=1 Tax=Ditylenchus destructor TaxID=166010 RepID=A0AAD4N0A9_9BILA|nr:RNA 3'-terminal phosphate cyclase domain-containing protein [Ditylenchus destructor]